MSAATVKPEEAKQARIHNASPGRTSPSLSHRLAFPLYRARRALADPRRLAKLHYSSVLSTLHSVAETDDFELLRRYFDLDAATFERIRGELNGDREFATEIEAAHQRARGAGITLIGHTAAGDHEPGLRFLYYLTRLLRPSAVVETGVFDGFSSAFILKGLRDNRHGHLHSIDLPARSAVRASTDKMRYEALPAGRDPGWLVPGELRRRWTLHLGESCTLLAPVLAELRQVELFFHDSLHTTENMSAEMEAAWPHLSGGGFLLSDDVFWNRAFWRFQQRHHTRGTVFKGIGVVRKPEAAASPDRRTR